LQSMAYFPWLVLFDRVSIFIIAVVSFIIALSYVVIIILTHSPSVLISSTVQEKRWPLTQDVSDIKKMYLFGVKQQHLEKISDTSTVGLCRDSEPDAFYLTVPKADTEASVRALVLSTQSSLSVAVIDIEGQQQLFTLGDSLTNYGGEIAKILADRVIIRNGAYCSALMFVD